MDVLLLVATLCALQQEPDALAFELEPLAKGISLAEDVEGSEQLRRARNYLEEGRAEVAVGLLQSLCESDPAAVVRSGSEGLLLGAAAEARRLLLSLGPEGRAARLTAFGDRAQQELDAALVPPDLAALQRVAWRYGGLPSGDRAARALEELWLDRGETGLVAGGAERPLPEGWREELGEALSRAPARAPAVEGPLDAGLPRLRADDLPREVSWSFDFSAQPHRGAETSHRMVFGEGLGFLTDGSEVVALELGTGRARWRYAGPQSPRPLDPVEIESMQDAESQHVLRMPVLHDGVLLVVLQEPIAVGKPDTYSRIDIRRVLPARRLYAFDARDGSVLWRQEVPWTAPGSRAQVEFACGPPAVAGGRVFLPVYDAVGTIDLSLLCLDLRSGEQLWKRFLISGQLVSNLFGNVLTELAVPPPVASDGRVLVCTHLGATSAVDAATGAVLWTRLYERMAVQTFESGRIGRRLASFAASLPACDGERFVCSPVDGPEALVLDPKDGTLLASFPARGAGGLFLRSLIGIDPDGVWMNGTRLAHLSYEGFAASQFTDPVTVEQGSYLPQPYAGLLIRDEVLVPGRRSVARFSWPGMRRLGDVLEQPRGDYRRIGPLQATHGLLLVMRNGGVDAYASPSALLETLLAADLTAEQLRTILPLLEQFGFASDSSFAQRVGDAALRLADEAAFRAQADQLRLLACRSLLAVDALDRALPVLGGLLESDDPEARYAAAGVLLEELPTRRPGDIRLARALELLRRERPAEVPLPDQRREPLAAVLARAELLAARRSGDADLLRETLVRTLLIGDPGQVSVDGTPLQAWAGRELRRLVRDPDQARQLEDEAALVFASDVAGDAELRAYAPSRAAQRWLRARLDAAPSGVADRIQTLRWCRSFGALDATWPELVAALADAPPPRLPAALDEIARFELDGQRVLAALVHEGDPVLFLQTRNDDLLRVVRHDRGWQQIALLPILPGERSGRTPNLSEAAFATEDGVALLFGDRWMHFDVHGTREERPLPSRVHSTPLRIGSMAAVLLAEAVDRMRLQVLDLRSGEPYHEEQLPRMVSQVQHLVSDGRWLFLAQGSSTQVLRVDLRHDTTTETFSLPFMAHDTELRALTVFGDGVALVMSQPGTDQTVQVAGPGTPYRRVLLERTQEARPFRPGRGYAWLLQSTRTTSQPDSRPPAALQWLDPDAPEEPWTYRFEGARVEMPQVPPYWLSRERQVDRQVVALLPTAGEGLRVDLLELGRGRVWSEVVDGLRFEDLVTVLPEPRRAADGWALLLPHSDPSSSAPLMKLVLHGDDGTQRASMELDARTRSSRYRGISLLDGLLLLRNGEDLLILGEQE